MRTRFGIISIGVSLEHWRCSSRARLETRRRSPTQLWNSAVARSRLVSATPWGVDLTYKDVKYPITVAGLSAGSVGATDTTASGSVYNLTKLEDFEGNYAAAGAGATVGGGGGVEHYAQPKRCRYR